MNVRFLIIILFSILSIKVFSQTEIISNGSGNSYVVTFPGAFSYTNGISLTFKSHTAITGPATISVNSLPSKNIVKLGSVNLETGDIKAGQIVTLVYDGTNFQMVTPSGNAPSGGTVTSVGLSLPNIFTVSGTPITSSGTLSATLGSQTQGTVFAAPAGTAGTPSFRLLTSTDITSLNASIINSGNLAQSFGGTGASLTGTPGGVVYSSSSSTMAISSAGTAGQVLQSNGTGSPSWVSPSFVPTGISGQTLRHNGTGWIANSFLYNDGTKIGIGTSSPQADLQITSTAPRLTLNNSASNSTNGSQLSEIWFNDAVTTNPQAGIRVFRDGAVLGDAPTAMAFYTTATGSLSNTEQMRLTKDGRLGIGTSSPGSKLSVSGDANIGSANTVSGAFAMAIGSNNTASGNRSIAIGNYTQAANIGSMVLGDWSSATPTILASTADDQFSARFSNGYRFFTTSSNQVSKGIFFAAGGNVGLGIAAPTQKLEINDGNLLLSNTGAAGDLRFQEANVNGTNFISFKAANAMASNLSYTFPATEGASNQVLTTNGSGTLSWQSASTLSNSWSLTGNSGTSVATNFIGTTDATDLSIRTNNTESVRITAGGNIGIGTATTGYGLFQAQSLGTNSKVVSISGMSTYTDDAPARLELRGSSFTNGDEIGVIDFIQRSDFNQDYNFARIAAVRENANATYASLRFYTRFGANMTEAMIIDENSNLGIGTSNPTAKLHVAGTTRIVDGTQGADKVLTSDASGNASWQNGSKNTGFAVYSTVSQTISSSTWTQINFGSEEFDDGADFASNTYTTPSTGVYQFNASVSWDGFLNSTGYHFIAFYVNGIAVKYHMQASHTNFSSNNLSSTIKLNAGDVVSVWVFHSSTGGSNVTYVDVNKYTWFNGYRLY